jgi:hypothetical protein
MNDDLSLRATFDQVAELYNQARPAYPDALFSTLIQVTGLSPTAKVLEIGPGTGQATKALASYGYDITGVELGAAWYLPEERQLKTSSEFFDSLCATLAGRAAEDIIFHDVSSGALDDLEKATKAAYMMVAYYGFNQQLGNVSFYDSTGMEQRSLQKPYSEATGKLIDEEVRQLVAKAYQRTKSLLISHQAALVAVARLLLEKVVLFKEDLQRILGNRPTGPEEPSTTMSLVEPSINKLDDIVLTQ